MKLADYLARIGFTGVARTDLETLQALHRAHVHAVTFEDLDVQLRRAVSMDVEAIYDKIVRRRRGGWCYELNGLLAWALQQIGFDVTRASAAVMRETMGEATLGNHLCLIVRLDRPYLVDVGFGSSLVEPLALEGSSRVDQPFHVGLAEVDTGYWRFTEQMQGEPFTFDFKPLPADEQLLATKCLWQQTNTGSPFVQNLVAKRRTADAYLTLRGRVLTRSDARGDTKTILPSADALVACLRDTFGLDVPESASLWPAICARHEALFGTQAK